jgi:hypothetical protein
MFNPMENGNAGQKVMGRSIDVNMPVNEAMSSPSRKLGDYLRCPPEQVAMALLIQEGAAATGQPRRLGQILMDEHLLSRDQLLQGASPPSASTGFASASSLRNSLTPNY